MYFTIEDLERHSLVIRTSQSVRAGATQIRVRSIPEGIVGEQIVIDVYGAHPETRTVTAQDTKYLTVAALAYGHAEDVAIVRMWLFDQAIVFNESGADVDTRIEAVGQANALFVQGSDGNVGLGTATPVIDLQVSDYGGVDGNVNQLIIQNNNYWDTGDSRDEHVKSGYANQINLINNTGGISFRCADTGAANSAVTWEEIMKLSLTGVVFNEGGADNDYRVEAVGQANALFVQGSDGNVGLGTATPVIDLQVSDYGGVAGNANQLIIQNNNYWDTGDSRDEYVKSGYANQINLINNTGGISFRCADTGAANSAVTWEEIMKLSLTGVVFNEGGADVDFRVESDTNSSCFVVDGGNNNVSIGTGSVSAHYALLLGASGVLALAHTTTPTEDGDIGKLYCKDDDKLYFLTDNGIQYSLDMTLA